MQQTPSRTGTRTWRTSRSSPCPPPQTPPSSWCRGGRTLTPTSPSCAASTTVSNPIRISKYLIVPHNNLSHVGECSADWVNFQENLAQLQLLEEDVVDSHKQLLSSLGNWMEQDATLLTMTNDVDYDQDGKCFCFPVSWFYLV